MLVCLCVCVLVLVRACVRVSAWMRLVLLSIFRLMSLVHNQLCCAVPDRESYNIGDREMGGGVFNNVRESSKPRHISGA